MNTPTPTPRPALKATGMRRRHARCLETELAALTAERDQLRAELEKVYLLVTPVGFDLPGGIFETAQAVTELRAERARLDWIESDAGMDWQWKDTMYGIVSRAAIDKAMKEGAK